MPGTDTVDTDADSVILCCPLPLHGSMDFARAESHPLWRSYALANETLGHLRANHAGYHAGGASAFIINLIASCHSSCRQDASEVDSQHSRNVAGPVLGRRCDMLDTCESAMTPRRLRFSTAIAVVRFSSPSASETFCFWYNSSPSH